MMNLLRKISNSLLKYKHFTPATFRVSLYSTQTQTSSPGSLSRRLYSCFDPQASMKPVLDQWVVDGKPINHEELRRIITDFKIRHQYRRALELLDHLKYSGKKGLRVTACNKIAEWTSDGKHFEIKPGDIALQLQLISKVHGVERAETYFHNLDDSLKVFVVYRSLLYCYADAKSLEKAEAVLRKIQKVNPPSIIIYNTMLRLYSEIGNYEKLDALTLEMEDKGIPCDEFSYNILIKAYGTSFNIERMENLLLKMEVDPMITVNYHSYVAAAKGYLNAGDGEKASLMLRKAEQLISGKGKPAYIVLLTVYASMQKKEDIFRLWNLLKKIGRPNNQYYYCMISSLVKVNDLDEAKKILEEWEENNIHFDIRVPNLVIHALCEKGHLTDAELIINRLLETGKKPSANTWSRIALGYYEKDLMERAVEMTRKAFLASYSGWKPDLVVVAACIEYLKLKGDAEAAEEIISLLVKNGNLSLGFKERLEKYVYDGKPKFEALEVGIH